MRQIEREKERERDKEEKKEREKSENQISVCKVSSISLTLIRSPAVNSCPAKSPRGTFIRTPISSHLRFGEGAA